MSIYLVDLVLRAKMPADMLARAPKKLVLLCLAKVCQNNEGLDCFPARSTMALAAERTERTVDAFLADLVARGFIRETRKARQHTPRTFALNVARLTDLQQVASLPTPDHSPDVQQVASLPTTDHSLDLQQVASLPTTDLSGAGVSDTQLSHPEAQLQHPEAQLSHPEAQQVATERTEQNERIQEPGAYAPVVVLSVEGDQETYPALRALADKVLVEWGTDASFEDLVGALKSLADQYHVQHDGTGISAAMALALSARRLRRWVH